MSDEPNPAAWPPPSSRGVAGAETGGSGPGRGSTRWMRVLVQATVIAVVVGLAAAYIVGAWVDDGRPSSSDDDMSGLAVLVFGLLAFLVVGALAFAISFAALGWRARLPRRQLAAGLLLLVTVPTAVVGAVAVHWFVNHRGLAGVGWLAVVAVFAGAAVAVAAIGGLASGRRLAVAGGSVIVVLSLCLVAAVANEGRHETALRRAFLDDRSIAVALPAAGSGWDVVVARTPTGRRGEVFAPELTVRGAGGVEVNVSFLGSSVERLCDGCVAVAISDRRGTVWYQRPGSVDVYLVAEAERAWMLLANGRAETDDVVGLVDALDLVSTDEWLVAVDRFD